MLDFEEIKLQYPESLQGYERAILREYLQCKILQGLFESRLANKISFLGGTALRIIYGNLRFSEDIDLDNFGLSWLEFEDLVNSSIHLLQYEGFLIENERRETAAFHCVVKFPEVLFEHGISPLREEKIRIQIDTYAQGYQYDPEIKILNKFDVFSEIRVTPKSTLLSQKIYSAVTRKRIMGRDFYDITYLLAHAKPDYEFLEAKIGIGNSKDLHSWMLSKIHDYDFERLAEDVSPFLINKEEVKRVKLFKEFWEQVEID